MLATSHARYTAGDQNNDQLGQLYRSCTNAHKPAEGSANWITRQSRHILCHVAEQHRPRMSPEQVELLRRWHDASHAALRAMLPADVSFMGLQLHITEDVFPIDESVEGDPYHQAVAKEVGPGLRVLDMGTGSGVSALLAAQTGSEVVAADVNPKAVECARANAERNGLAAHITFVHGDLFQGVEGDFDLIIFDPPFRW